MARHIFFNSLTVLIIHLDDLVVSVMMNAEGEYYYIEATPTARYQSIYPNEKRQGQAQLLFIDGAPKKSTVAISLVS